MISRRKGVAPYLLVLGFVSVIMATFLFFILTIIYGDDPQQCQKIDYEVEPMCSFGEGAQVKILNNAEGQLTLAAGRDEQGRLGEHYSVSAGGQDVFRIMGSGKISLMPVVQVGIEEEVCNGKTESFRLGVLGSC